MIYPGGWNALEISEPSPIKPIIAQASVNDGVEYDGVIKNSTFFYTPGGVWVPSPLTLVAEPQVFAVNGPTFLDEFYKSDAMNGQTKMSNLTDAPPPMSNNIYLYGNKNGILKFQMQFQISWLTVAFNLFEISVLENAATDGGTNGVVQVYEFDKGSPFTSPVTFKIMFDNFFGPVNLGIRATDGAAAPSIMALRCIILDTDPR